MTIYFVCDNTGVIPTGEDVVDARKAVLTIKDATTPDESVFVLSPNPLYVDFLFNSINPNTIEMRTAITARLKELFSTDAFIEQDLGSDVYRSKISNTIDATGATLETFSLSEPFTDIRVGTGEIPVLRNVIFDTNIDSTYIPVMFDGQSGHSDGTANGISKEITGNNITVDVVVKGVFDGALVVLQQYDAAQSSFVNKLYGFTQDDTFTGLFVQEGDRFRLQISQAGTNTAIVSEVNYS